MDKYGLPATYNALMSTIGNEIGSGNVRYIQDVGTKTAGVPYLDKNTNKMYLCMTTTDSVNNDNNFTILDMIDMMTRLNYFSGIKFRKSNIEVPLGVTSLELFSAEEFRGMKDESNIYVAIDGNGGGQIHLLIVPVSCLRAQGGILRPWVSIVDYDGWNSTKSPLVCEIFPASNNVIEVRKMQNGVANADIPRVVVNLAFVI